MIHVDRHGVFDFLKCSSRDCMTTLTSRGEAQRLSLQTQLFCTVFSGRGARKLTLRRFDSSTALLVSTQDLY